MHSTGWESMKNWHWRIYDVGKDQLLPSGSSISDFIKFLNKVKNKSEFYFEEGGGDSFKLLAKREGHNVFTIPGKKIKKFISSLKFKKEIYIVFPVR